MEKEKEQKESADLGSRLDIYYRWAKFLLIILLVVGAGVFAVNQVLKYNYNSQLLQAPCELCASLNKNQSECIQDCFRYRVSLYPALNGDWIDSKGKCYDLAGKEKECKTKSYNGSKAELNLTQILRQPV